jgi:RNA polymerase sigma-70 factor (ECF subfamily)
METPRAFPDDAELVRQAQTGDQSAFMAIYERCQPSIYTYVFYRVSDVGVAEDLTAEVFTRMVARIRSFVPSSRPILAWLYTIAANLVTDHYRQNGREGSLPLPENLRAEEADPFHLAERRLTQAQLAAALTYLTEDQRQVILLKFVERRSNAEIAAVLGKNEGSVKSLQHRALAALRRLLEVEPAYEFV